MRRTARVCSQIRPVPLASECFAPPAPSAVPILVLPGLFGAKHNWKAVAKALACALNRTVYTLDLRNHGDSPHHPLHSYPAMAADVHLFVTSRNIQRAAVIGHSMGGKVLMHMALEQLSWLDASVVVDISPVIKDTPSAIDVTSPVIKDTLPVIDAKQSISPVFKDTPPVIDAKQSILPVIKDTLPVIDAKQMSAPHVSIFGLYINLMLDLQNHNIKTLAAADEFLAAEIPTLAIRQFLLTNLKKQEEGYRFRINLHALKNHLSTIGSFPSHKSPYNGRMLFIRGGSSDYLPPSDFPYVKALFPNADIKTIGGAGHWVHAEKSKEFLALTGAFFKDAL